MNKSHALSIALISAAALPGISIASDIFDFPGPGYWEQAERFSPFGDPLSDTHFSFQPGSRSSPLLRPSDRDLPEGVITRMIPFPVEPTSPLNPPLPSPFSPPLPNPVPDLSQPIRLFASPPQPSPSLSLGTSLPLTPKESK